MYSARRAGLAALFLFLFSSVWGQLRTDAFHYTAANGLSNNRICCIMKDREGFMWIGTWAGINSFDGRGFKTFKSSPGDYSPLKNNRIDEIYQGKGALLWLHAFDKRIYLFDKTSNKFSALTELIKEKAFDNVSFKKILAVDDDGIWLISVQGEIFQVYKNGKSYKFSIFPTRSISNNQPPASLIFFHIDKSKRVWISTTNGLQAFVKTKGGYRAGRLGETYNLRVSSFYERNGDVWMSTDNGHLIYVDKSFKRILKFKVADDGLNDVIVSPNNDSVFCSTDKGQIILLNKSGKTEKLFATNDNTPLYYLYHDKLGQIWAESESFGMVKINPTDKKAVVFFRAGSLPAPRTKYHRIFEDRNGRVWLYNSRLGLRYHDRAEDRLVQYSLEKDGNQQELPLKLKSLLYDDTGVLWLIPEGRGLYKIVLKNNSFSQFRPNPKAAGESQNEVRALYTDRRNRLWAATKMGGLHLYKDGKELKIILANQKLSGAAIYSILEDSRGRMWFGTKSDGLFKAEPLAGSPEQYQVTQYTHNDHQSGSISSNSIYALLEDKSKRIWAGTYDKGLLRVEEKYGETFFHTIENTFKNYPAGNYGRIRHLAEDSFGRIWIASTEGLVIAEEKLERPGLYEFSVHKKKKGSNTSLGGDDVQFIYQDSKKRMWVLSSGGLNLGLGTNPMRALRFLNYSSREGLPSDYLLSCQEDATGNLWIATENGLSKFSPREQKFRNYGSFDGLKDLAFSEAATAKMRKGNIFFGTTSGYLFFNPDQISTQRISAKMALTNLQVNNKDVLPGSASILQSSLNSTEQVELQHNENTISIDFALLDYRGADKEKYFFRLVGFDSVWKDSYGERRSTYTNLPPGDYTFEVKGINDELYSNVPFHSLRITIFPPWWKTGWAYVVYGLLAMLSLVIARRVILIILKLRQGIEVEKRLADLKLKFFTQVSHELRTPLTLIINPAEEVLDNENLSPKGRDYISVVVKNARRMVRLVNQLLDLRKVQSGGAPLNLSEVDIVSFVVGVMDYFKETVTNRKISLEVICPYPELLVWIDPAKIDIVLYNLFANAIKFSSDNSTISIRISCESAGFFSIEVADEGVGVAEDELAKIFDLYYQGRAGAGNDVKGTGIGLALSRELVELHDGKIIASHNSPRGLIVSVRLKLGKEHYSSEILETNNVVSDFVEAELEIGDLNLPTTEAVDAQRVLLVEDNCDLRNFIASKLAEQYYVFTAENGEEGLQKAKEFAPDLILSDIMMPRLNGIELLQQLKSDPETSHIPVILLTAKYAVESQIEGLNHGADYYITKPFRMELLQAALANLIVQRRKMFDALIAGNKHPISIPVKSSLVNRDQQFLEKVIKLVEEKLTDPDFSIETITTTIGMSRSALYRKLKGLTRLSPIDLIKEIRLNKAKELFDQGEDNISVVAYSVGFNDPKYFSTCFKSQFNQTPSDYLKSLQEGVN